MDGMRLAVACFATKCIVEALETFENAAATLSNAARQHNTVPSTSDVTVNLTVGCAFLEGKNAVPGHEAYVLVLLPWFFLALGLVVFYLISRWLHFLPYTAVVFVLGICTGAGAILAGCEDILTISINQWTKINYEVLFCSFLPGLLFKDAL
jgi:hypothetical protein